MTIEAMKQALEALEEWEKSMSKGSLEAHRILRTAIEQAEKQEGWVLREVLFDEGEPIAHREPAQQEPVAWPCEIEEADFEKDTITLKMLTAQYVVRAGKHWLSTTPPAQPAEPAPVPWSQALESVWAEDDTTPPAAQPCPYIRSTAEGTHHCALSQRQPLTDEKIDDIWNRYCDEMGEASINDAYDIARAIEAAHGITGEKPDAA